MSTQNTGAPIDRAGSEAPQQTAKLHPAPSFVWMLLPLGLLALLAFLSR